MMFTTNAFRRAAAGAALVLSALAIPATTAQAATPPTSTLTASTTGPRLIGPYANLHFCLFAANGYGGPAKGVYCIVYNNHWYVRVPA